MKKQCIVGLAAIMALGMLSACNEGTGGGASEGEGVTTVTEAEWKAAWGIFDEGDGIAVDCFTDVNNYYIEMSYKKKGNIEYMAAIDYEEKDIVQEEYIVYNDAALTATIYTKGIGASLWAKEIQVFTQEKYEDRKNGYWGSFYLKEFSQMEGGEVFTVSDLYSAFTYDEKDELYKATLFYIEGKVMCDIEVGFKDKKIVKEEVVWALDGEIPILAGKSINIMNFSYNIDEIVIPQEALDAEEKTEEQV